MDAAPAQIDERSLAMSGPNFDFRTGIKWFDAAMAPFLVLNALATALLFVVLLSPIMTVTAVSELRHGRKLERFHAVMALIGATEVIAWVSWKVAL